MPRVRDAIRETLSAAASLFTPNRKPFPVVAVGVDEIGLPDEPHSASTLQTAFDALDAIPSDMFQYGDQVPINAIAGDAAQGTLGLFLLDRHGDGVKRVSYPAPTLVEAGGFLYLPSRTGELQRIGLRPKRRLLG